jgi:hypothetical protein
MKIKNTSDIYSTKQIREVVNFVRPSGIDNFDVMVKNSKSNFQGRAYMNGSDYHFSYRPFVVIRIGKMKFPYHRSPFNGYLRYSVFSQEEILVVIIAHELRHLWQYKHPKGWRVYGAKGRFSERDADAYAIRQLRKWRRK